MSSAGAGFSSGVWYEGSGPAAGGESGAAESGTGSVSRMEIRSYSATPSTVTGAVNRVPGISSRAAASSQRAYCTRGLIGPPQKDQQNNQRRAGENTLLHFRSLLAFSSTADSSSMSRSVRPRPSARVFTIIPTLPR